MYGKFKEPMPKIEKAQRRTIEINDLVMELNLEEQVRSTIRKAIDRNPDLVEKAKVSYMDSTELAIAKNNNNRDATIMILEKEEPICKSTQIFAIQRPVNTDTLSNIFKE